MRAVLPALALVSVASLSAVRAPASIPYKHIASSGPLTHLYLGNTLSCQVARAGDETLEFYEPTTVPGDCGTFLATGDDLYAPDFRTQGITSTLLLGSYTVFNPVSQNGVSGSGTAADPFKVVTVVAAGPTGLRISQVDSYVKGRDSYRTDITITNNGSSLRNVLLYRAGDCYLGGSDIGYGFSALSRAVACTKNPNNKPAGRVQQWVPVTNGSRYYEDAYNLLWAKVGAKEPFEDRCSCETPTDNAAGLSWTASLAPGAARTFSHLTNFGVAAVASTLTAAPAAVDLSAAPRVHLQLSAHLSKRSDDAPVAGRLVEFSIGETQVCSATTDAAGDAECGGIADVADVLINGSYTALFSGDVEYLASVGTAPFARVFGTDLP